MKSLSGLDAAFLHLETPATPMHVGSLSLLDVPASTRAGFFAKVRRLYARRVPLAPVLRRRLRELPLQLANPVWVQADAVDLGYHIRKVVLPKPGTLAQLDACVGQLHSILLDRTRPLWTVTVIEGLQNGQVAYYTNIHHAVIDGQAGVELAKALFDLTPASRRAAAVRTHTHGEHPWSAALIAGALQHDVRQYASFLRSLPAMARTIVKAQGAARKEAPVPTQRSSGRFGPKTPFNVAITSARGFAGVSIPLDEVQAVATAHGGTINDVVLALCAGALRQYLRRHGGVPQQALIAAVPISLREAGKVEFTTQATLARVGLATNLADPVRRLQAIRDAAGSAKAATARVKSVLPTDFPAIGLPWFLHGLATLYGRTGMANVVSPLVNVVISNVRGSPAPLYFAGARVVSHWPLSIVGHGLGINLTVESYAGALGFGVTTAACAVQDPRRIADGLVAAHAQLMKRSGLQATTPHRARRRITKASVRR